jgi:hypothetical protein
MLLAMIDVLKRRSLSSFIYASSSSKASDQSMDHDSNMKTVNDSSGTIIGKAVKYLDIL